VLRRIIRRTLRHGYKLDRTNRSSRSSASIARWAGYPAAQDEARVADVLKAEEERFGERSGMG
jgi:alanyl-tRNA synthetase